jgi:copper chaperone CopZ
MKNTTDHRSLTLAIQGMHCGGCVRRVTNALASVPGTKVEVVQVGSAELSYDPTATSPEQITAAIDAIGFKAAAE